jgi:hypothetical protein
MSTQICEPVLGGGVFDVAFFNGRVLTAEDMRAEQSARRQMDARLGRAIGSGVVSGLEVSIATVGESTAVFKDGRDGRDAALAITSGLAVAPMGRTLELSADVELSVVRPQFTTSDSGFHDCRSDQLHATHTGVGLYLLTVSHAIDYRERVPMVELGSPDRISGCGNRYEVQGVAFRLIKLAVGELGLEAAPSTELTTLIDATSEREADAPVAKLSQLRNRVAHAFFGTALLPRVHRDPFTLLSGQPEWPTEIGALALLSGLGRVGEDEVPLAIVHWTRRGIGFVDTWAVRRRPSVAWDGKPWRSYLNERRVRVAEAVWLQFQDQLSSLQTTLKTQAQVAAVTARDYFRYLPPAGLLPKPFAGNRGFDAATFCGDVASEGTAMTDGDLLPALFADALMHEPIDLDLSTAGLRRYDVWGNDQATVLVSHTVPRIFGVGRYESARWDWNRFA